MNLTKLNFEMSKIFPKHFKFGDNTLKPVQFSLPEATSVTLWDGNEDAFNLKAPIVGNIKNFNLSFSGQSNKKGVYRGLIGYKAVSEMEKNPESIAYTMSLMINDGLRQLTLELGNLTNRNITLGYVGTDDYFRPADHYAAAEFRIMVE